MGIMSLKSNKHEYLTLKDGEKALFVLAGEPSKFYQKFGDKNRYSEWRDGLTTRYNMWALQLVGDNAFAPKVFTFGSTLKQEFVDLADANGEDIIIEMVRKGTGKKTEYKVAMNAKLTPEQKAKVDSLDLPSLVFKASSAEPRETTDTTVREGITVNDL